jgi:hypothetical protein
MCRSVRPDRPVRASFWRDVMYCNHCADWEFGQGPADAARGRRETSPCTLWSPAFVLAYPTEAMQVGGELTSGVPEQEPQGSCPYVAGWQEGGPTATRPTGDASRQAAPVSTQ